MPTVMHLMILFMNGLQLSLAHSRVTVCLFMYWQVYSINTRYQRGRSNLGGHRGAIAGSQDCEGNTIDVVALLL